MDWEHDGREYNEQLNGMNHESDRPGRLRQYSLRTLFVATLVVAGLAATQRVFGSPTAIWTTFVGGLVASGFLLPSGWRAAFRWSIAAAFGPFMALAVYTTAFISCSHCMAASWQLLPCGPGIVLIELARQWLRLPHPGDAAGMWLSLFLAVVMVAVLTWLIRRRRWWWQAANLLVVASLQSLCAIGLLAAIQA